jgi:transcription elongation factor GreA
MWWRTDRPLPLTNSRVVPSHDASYSELVLVEKLERPNVNKPVLLTAEGRADMETEYNRLVTVRRVEIAEQLGSAADDGDLSENAAYDHAKEEQALLEGRIARLEHTLRHAVVIQNRVTEFVQVGSKVTIDDEGLQDTYVILGPLESAPGKGRISNESPMGRALMNHKAGDVVDVHAPAGVLKIRIISIE